MGVDFTTCLVFNTRMAARAVTRRYDARLRVHGITATQFSLLGAIARDSGETVSALAARNGIERTGLSRNLGRLERLGLIESRPAEKGNGRVCSLTPAGEALIEKLVPFWQAAQDEMRDLLTPAMFSTTLDVLTQLARV